jgi:hypothetical protein
MRSVYISDADAYEFVKAIRYFHDRMEALVKSRSRCRGIGEEYQWDKIGVTGRVLDLID